MTLANRMLKRAPETADDLLPNEMVTWSDNANKEAWYYLAVQEATNSHIPEHKKDHTVPGLNFEYEHWVKMIENRDWAQLEKDIILALAKTDNGPNFVVTAYLYNSDHNNLQRTMPQPLKQYQTARLTQVTLIK
jgi:hypothetical protein